MKTGILCGAIALLAAGCFPALAEQTLPVVRVALMDFSTDDNSYRSTQNAADLTRLAQIQLGNEPGIEWVERAQLDLARKEIGLTDMGLLAGASRVRLGKWVKADWTITGLFSLDDHSRRTLSLEITDLQHADVLASGTFRLPENTGSNVEPNAVSVSFVARIVRGLLSDARARQQRIAGHVVIAPLFFADTSGFGFRFDSDAVQRGFFEALDRASASNARVRLIHFPKAYQAMEESEMVLDGLVETDANAWQRAADLYVWGTYASTNVRSGSKIEPKLVLTFHLWDQSSEPVILTETTGTLDPARRGAISLSEVSGILSRVADQIVNRARKRDVVGDSSRARHHIADSIVKTYLQMTAPGRSQPGFGNDVSLVQAVHMLETACFFDPEYAEAQVLRITCRWGWWMDFRFNVKNQFWSKWRRSQAWGKYVDRFGLGKAGVKLPFPYDREGIPGVYVNSAEEVEEMCPEYIDEYERDADQSGVWTAVKEAQAHGFPREISKEIIVKWKAELQAELAARMKKVAEFSELSRATNATTMTSSRGLSGRDARPPPKLPPEGLLPQFSPAPAPKMVEPPAWFEEIKINFRMFSLAAPVRLPPEVKPAVEEIKFPRQFEVNRVNEIQLYQGKALILAIDERSSPSSDPNPSLSSELLSRRGRLWCLEPGSSSPELLEPELLPKNIRTFVVDGDRLWVVGERVGYVDLRQPAFRAFGLADGLAIDDPNGLAVAGGRVYVAGFLQVFRSDSVPARWENVPLPMDSAFATPCFLVGNDRWLGYVAGSVHVYQIASASWAKLPDVPLYHSSSDDRMGLVTDKDGLWFGSDSGLYLYEPASGGFQRWESPVSVRGIQNPLVDLPYFGPTIGSRIPEETIRRADEQLQGQVKNIQKARARIHAENRTRKASVDPFALNWHIPGEIRALADDGDFLWIGAGNYFGNCLLLMHKPSRSLVACLPLPVRNRIASLAVSDRHVWLGTAYGDQLLLRMSKEPFLSVPPSQWMPIAISPAERKRLVKTMNVRDQAVYAFHAGDDATVVDLLGNLDPEKASLEQMFLLAFSYDSLGLNKPDQSRAWFERIIARYPDSPWAKVAADALAANEQDRAATERAADLVRRFDRNHDGVLDRVERSAMEGDPAYRREETAIQEKRLDIQLEAILRRYDINQDGKLDKTELSALKNRALVYAQAPPEMLAGRDVLLAPLVTRDFRSETVILRKYDANTNGGLDASELKIFARELRKAP